ncbi:MAG: YeeE/YedE family protein [Pseudomonadales bacterium]|nr:YeeE/YedE family protein [Pseudomonadales bacterium]
MAGIVAVVTGLLFGAGLAASGMTNPEKVQGFLDLTGVWDPSLMFVMGGAVVVTLISFRFILKLSRPVFSEQFHMPSSTSIDTRLIIGAALFGIGWGLVGYCPGPALAAIAYLNSDVMIFLVAMFVGAFLGQELLKPR